MDASHVYWTGAFDGDVRRVPRSGGKVQVISTGESYTHGASLVAGHVYWLSSLGSQYRLRRARPDGSGSEVLATWKPELGDSTYFCMQRVLPAGGGAVIWPAGKEVKRWSPTAGSMALARQDDNAVQALVSANGELFWATHQGGGVQRTEPGQVVWHRGGAVKDRVLVPTGVRGNLTRAGQRLIYAAAGLWILELPGQPRDRRALDPLGQPWGLAVVGREVLWTDRQRGIIRAADPATGGPRTLAAGQPDALCIAADSGAVAWSTGDDLATSARDGAIHVLALPAH